MLCQAILKEIGSKDNVSFDERINFRRKQRTGQLPGLPFSAAGGAPRQRVQDSLLTGIQRKRLRAAVYQNLYIVRLMKFFQAHTVDPHFQPAKRKNRLRALRKELAADNFKTGSR